MERAMIQSQPKAQSNTVIRGVAAPFGVWSAVLKDGNRQFRECIAPTAFDSALAGGDVFALWQHDAATPLARTRNGSLRLWKEEQGLCFELKVGPEGWGQSVVAAVRAGLVLGASVGFLRVRFGDTERFNSQAGLWERTLHAVDLRDISLVTFPAYSETSATVRLYDPAAEKRRRAQAEFQSRKLGRILRQTQATIDAYELTMSTVRSGANPERLIMRG